MCVSWGRPGGRSGSGGGAAGSVTPSSSSTNRRAHAVARAGATSCPWTVLCSPMPSSTALSRAAVSAGSAQVQWPWRTPSANRSASTAARAAAKQYRLRRSAAAPPPSPHPAVDVILQPPRVHPQRPALAVGPLLAIEIGGQPVGRVVVPARDVLEL